MSKFTVLVAVIVLLQPISFWSFRSLDYKICIAIHQLCSSPSRILLG